MTSRRAAIGGGLKAARAPAQTFKRMHASPRAGPASQIQPFQMKSSWKTRVASVQPIAVAPSEPRSPAAAPAVRVRAGGAEKPCGRTENGELGALRREHLGAARPQRPHHRRLVRTL